MYVTGDSAKAEEKTETRPQRKMGKRKSVLKDENETNGNPAS